MTKPSIWFRLRFKPEQMSFEWVVGSEDNAQAVSGLQVEQMITTLRSAHDEVSIIGVTFHDNSPQRYKLAEYLELVLTQTREHFPV